MFKKLIFITKCTSNSFERSELPHGHRSWCRYVQSSFNFSPYTMKHIARYLLSSFSFSCFQMIQASNCFYTNAILYIAPKEKSRIVKSGLLGGHRFELHLSIHLPRDVALWTSMTSFENCGGAPFAGKLCLELFQWEGFHVSEPHELPPLFFVHSVFNLL
jgi:hypothetical protein